MRVKKGIAVAAVVAAVFGASLLVGSAGATGPGNRQVCGLLPGDGAYSFIKTRNVSCKVARKVTRKAGREFCSQGSNCDAPPTGGIDKGKVKAKGWKCEMKVGYEFFRAKCHRQKMKFKAESAA